MSVVAETNERLSKPRLGPWIAEELLGRGAAGDVWRARHRETGVVAAVKTVRSPREAFLRAQRREIDALARVEHPGVVRVLGSGFESGVPYCAMELVRGTTLRAWRSDASARESASSTAIDIVARVALALSVVHGRGIVHRDLKPENIIIKADGTPVLVDFGLATDFRGGHHRESLSSEGGMVGSAAYMAPEQVDGDVVDARADLYALGCILYELLAGSPPFTGTLRSVLSAHRTERPAALSTRARDVPPALESLTMRLLEKLPRDRFGYAEDVARVLVANGANVLREASGASELYLYRPPLIAREGTVATLEGLVRDANAGNGRLAALVGPSGIGKTRLAVDLMRRAERMHVRVLAASCWSRAGQATSNASGGASSHALRAALDVVADRCREWGADEAKRVLGGRARVLEVLAPSMSNVPGLEQEPEPESVHPEAARQRIVEAICDTFAALAESDPILLVIDDVQWADDLTLAFLEFVVRTRRFESAAILVVVTVRVEETHRRLDDWLSQPGVAALEIQRLDRASLQAMIGEMLGTSELSDRVIATVADHVDGNPFFTGEYLRLLVTDGLLRRDDAGRWQLGRAGASTTGTPGDLSRVPESIGELLQRRIVTMSACARHVANAAAVLTAEADDATLCALSGVSPVDFDSAVDELRRRMVVEHGEIGLRFAHDKLREAVYANLATADRKQLHQRAAETLLAQPAGSPLAVARREIGHHYLAADMPVQAKAHLVAASVRDAALFANEDAVRHLEALLSVADRLGATQLQEASWRRQLADAFAGLGRIDDARRVSGDALALLGRRAPKSDAMVVVRLCVEAIGQLRRRMFDSRPVHPHVAAGATFADASHEAARALIQHVFLISDTPRIVHGILLGANLSEDSGDVAMEARFGSALGSAYGLVGLHRLAEAQIRRIALAADRSGDPSVQAWVCMTEAHYRSGMAQWDGARAAAQHGEHKARIAGDLRRREECLSLLCEVEIQSGDIDRALERADTTLHVARARGDRQTQLWALCNRSRALLVLDRNAEALEDLTLATRLVERTMAADGTMADGLLSLALARAGDRASSFARARSAIELACAADTTVYHGLHGPAAAIEAFATLHRDRPLPGAMVKLAERAVSSLHAYARTFAIARPKYWLARGRLERMRDRKDRSRQAFDRAAELAKRFAMHPDLALAERARDGLA